MDANKRILVTGGAGFIGSALVRMLIAETPHQVAVLDRLTYAGNLESLEQVASQPRYQFCHCDIGDRAKVTKIFAEFQPDAIMHLAAESHVDRSIDSPGTFIETNITGTYNLLECARHYYEKLSGAKREGFRFHQISTDEVFGDLGDGIGLFSETTPYAPSSPYSASKAAADHLVRAWHRTYGLPVVISNCSNNYGPYHFPEKMIPLMILNALELKPLPIYGHGDQIRDWLYVDDHVRALLAIVMHGKVGESYNVGGHNEMSNLALVKTICSQLDRMAPRNDGKRYDDLIVFVTDRPGHDRRYAIDATKIERELNWRPRETFETGLVKTIQWYIEHKDNWCKHIQDGTYQRQRLGLGGANL